MTEAGKKLTALQRQGAVLEAAMYKRDDIARILDVAPGTVQGWHKNDMYISAVDEYGQRANEAIGPIITRIRSDVVDAAWQAVKMLRDAIEAVDKDGNPRWPVRIQAAGTLHAYLRTIAGSADGGDDSGGGPSSATATVVVVMDEEGKVHMKKPKAIEGTAEEK
jgi:hypothetical protein